jgi:hypothetical protein
VCGKVAGFQVIATGDSPRRKPGMITIRLYNHVALLMNSLVYLIGDAKEPADPGSALRSTTELL